MNGWKDLGNLSGFLRDPRQIARLNSILLYALLLGGSIFASQALIDRVGTQMFSMALIGIFFGTIYTIISFGNLVIPFLVFMLSVGGFKFLWAIRTPLLPDLFLDRMTLIWLAVVFFVKFFAERRKPKGPFVLDLLLLALGLYVLTDIFIRGMFPFNSWTMSYLIPYTAYFFAKNLITTKARIHAFLMVLMALFVYYGITSIAEKFNIDMLIWPKYILTNARFWGRSNGPFGHAPLFGTAIGMLIPINLYFITRVRHRLFKLLLYANLLVGLAGLYFTYTRGSWLAGVVALLVVVALNPRQYLKIFVPAMVMAPLLAIFVLGIAEDKFFRERVENEDTFGSRLGTFVTATKVWRANPIFGVGFYNYRFRMDDYIEPLEVPGFGTVNVDLFRHNPPHDIFVSFLAETGLVGVMLQGTIYFLILRTFIAKFRWRKKGDYFAANIMPVFAGLFLGYLTGGLAIDYKFFSVVGTLFYTCAGIMYGYQGEDSGVSEVVLRDIPGNNGTNPSLSGVLKPPSSQADQSHVP